MRSSRSSGFDCRPATGTIRHTVGVFCLALAVSTVAQGQDGANQSGKAAHVFREIMEMPGKSIPRDLLGDALCVAIFPAGGFISRGCGRRGVVSCRTVKAWSAPAFFDLGGGSIELQIGARETDFVMLVMNDDGLNSLLADRFTPSGEVSAAAGPIGRQAGASTDLKLSTQILSYSRSNGVFAGLEITGVVIKLDRDGMRDVYGEGVTAKEVLTKNKIAAPIGVWAFPITLWYFSSQKTVEQN
jgi:SH3 domain-containing YSC84-like protein 1